MLVLLLAVSIQAGCGGDDDGGGDAPALEGTEWTLADGVDAPDDSVPTLTLEEGTASGFGGCNSFTGGYELDGDSITIGPLAATLMACEDDKSAAEAAYLPALEAADSWAIEDGELVLSTDGEETLRFEAADGEDPSAAQVQQLEEENAALRQENAELEEQSTGFEQQVADLQQSLDDLQSRAEGGAAGAQQALDAARARYEALADELGAKGQSLAQSRAELRRLRAESEAALAAAQDAASTAAERAEAQQARAELAEACLARRRRRPAALLCQRRPRGCHRADDRGARAGRRRVRAAGVETDPQDPGGVPRPRENGRISAWALLPVLLTAALVAAAPAGADLQDEIALAERYAPVVRLVEQAEECGPGEPYEPLNVDLLFDEPTVALRGPWGGGDLVEIGPTADDLAGGLYEYHLDFPGNALDPGCTYELWARRLSEGEAPAVYAHVVDDPGHPGELALQYWLFYAYNDWNNLHEGDWEMIQLLFDAEDAAAALDGRADEDRLQPARGRRAGRLGRGQARARGRDTPGRAPGRRLARELLRGGALPRQLGRAGRRLRRHERPHRRPPADRDHDPERPGRGAGGVSLDRLPGPLGRAPAAPSSTAPRART